LMKSDPIAQWHMRLPSRLPGYSLAEVTEKHYLALNTEHFRAEINCLKLRASDGRKKPAE
jgi:hypothetical protein